MKFREKVQNFMYGRNGSDALNSFIFILFILVFIAELIVSKFSSIAYYILSGVGFLLVILYIWRAMSKNIVKRQLANDKFLNGWRSIKKPFVRFGHKIRDRKTYIYKKCPKCKQSLRLRKIKGEHTVKCPICENRFTIKVK